MQQKSNNKRKYQKQKNPKQKPNKYAHEDEELAAIEQRIQQGYETCLRDETIKRFDQLPFLSSKTLEGLTKSNFIEMTDIQRHSLPISLCGKDVLGAAKTGSGKTLAFIIPILERLYRAKWTPMDGLGALIISPTRELALQIFDVLRKVGRGYSFSAGLLIGGKDVQVEKQRVGRMNILVATPGRLLQHLDETVGFDCSQLQLLVLDEADRILDCGFENTMNAILDHLPRSNERQTLLFSATQTKSVKDLARLSLRDPEYVSVHEKADSSTPIQLKQQYIVRLAHQIFCKLQPGIVLMDLHGKQKQPKRLAIFEQYCRKKAVCLFATDVAARGLDFPAVDWVIQVDLPEDAETYIHRVGRTARYESAGNALTLMLPSEEAGFLKLLEKKKIPIKKTAVQRDKVLTGKVQRMLQNLCSQNPETKYLAQKSFISYVRSIYLQKNKDIFNVDSLPLEAFAESLGLPGTPKIKFIKKSDKKNTTYALQSQDKDQEEEEEEEEEEKKPVTKVEKMFKKKNQSVLSEHYQKLISDAPEEQDQAESQDDDDDDFMVMKRKDHDIDGIHVAPREFSKRQLLREKQKELSSRGLGKKFIFDEDGNPVLSYKFESVDEYKKKLALALKEGKSLSDFDDSDVEKALKDQEDEPEAMEDVLQAAAEVHAKRQETKLKKADVEDRQREKERLKEKKRAKKLKEREQRRQESGGPAAVAAEEGMVEEEDNYEAPEFSDIESDVSAATFRDYQSNSDQESDSEPEEPLDIDLDENNVEPRKPMKRARTEDEAPVKPKKSKTHSLADLQASSLEDIALKLLQ